MLQLEHNFDKLTPVKRTEKLIDPHFVATLLTYYSKKVQNLI